MFFQVAHVDRKLFVGEYQEYTVPSSISCTSLLRSEATNRYTRTPALNFLCKNDGNVVKQGES